MTKVKSPLFSLSAEGAFGNQLNYFKNYNSNTVGIIKPPPYRNTQFQKNTRQIYNIIVNEWAIANTTIKLYFNALAINKPLHGYNLFFKLWFASLHNARYGYAIYGIARYN